MDFFFLGFLAIIRERSPMVNVGRWFGVLGNTLDPLVNNFDNVIFERFVDAYETLIGGTIPVSTADVRVDTSTIPVDSPLEGVVFRVDIRRVHASA